MRTLFDLCKSLSSLKPRKSDVFLGYGHPLAKDHGEDHGFGWEVHKTESHSKNHITSHLRDESNNHLAISMKKEGKNLHISSKINGVNHDQYTFHHKDALEHHTAIGRIHEDAHDIAGDPDPVNYEGQGSNSHVHQLRRKFKVKGKLGRGWE